VAPRERQRFTERFFIDRIQSNIRGALLAPCALNGSERSRVSSHPVSLLVGCEADHAPFFIGIPERGEDPATDAEVGMTVVRLFDGVFETERHTSKSCRRHALMFD
jgi:hypothetical protein